MGSEDDLTGGSMQGAALWALLQYCAIRRQGQGRRLRMHGCQGFLGVTTTTHTYTKKVTQSRTPWHHHHMVVLVPRPQSLKPCADRSPQTPDHLAVPFRRLCWRALRAVQTACGLPSVTRAPSAATPARQARSQPWCASATWRSGKPWTCPACCVRRAASRALSRGKTRTRGARSTVNAPRTCALTLRRQGGWWGLQTWRLRLVSCPV